MTSLVVPEKITYCVGQSSFHLKNKRMFSYIILTNHDFVVFNISVKYSFVEDFSDKSVDFLCNSCGEEVENNQPIRGKGSNLELGSQRYGTSS